MEYTEKEIEKIIKDCDWEMENFQRLSSKESDNLMKVVKQLVKSLLFGVGSSKRKSNLELFNEINSDFIQALIDDCDGICDPVDGFEKELEDNYIIIKK